MGNRNKGCIYIYFINKIRISEFNSIILISELKIYF